MESKNILAIFGIILLFGTAIILFYLGWVQRSQLIVCQNEESIFCFTVTCQDKTETCGNYGYRCTGNGKVRCSNAPLVEVDIKPEDITKICT